MRQVIALTPAQKIFKMEEAMRLALAVQQRRTRADRRRPKRPYDIDESLGYITDNCRSDALDRAAKCCVGHCGKMAKIKIIPNFAKNNSPSSRYPTHDMCKQVIAYLEGGSKAFGFCLAHQPDMFNSLHNSFGM